MAELRIQTLHGELAPHDAGFTLCHEHLLAAFGGPTGDLDLELTCPEEIASDLAAAREGGVRTVVEVSTHDMRPDLEAIARLSERSGLRVVKSTGWFRSPSVDPELEGRSAEGLCERLIADLEQGLPGPAARAGCLGEIAITGVDPTPAERRNLDATAAASIGTGAGVVCHTDNRENADALVAALRERGVAPQRFLLGHARVADPMEWQAEMIAEGITLAFDQVGHPRRDPIESVCERVVALLERGAARIALSADLGRRSRLTAFGGQGYVRPLLALIERLRDRGLSDDAIDRLTGRNAAEFLARPARA